MSTFISTLISIILFSCAPMQKKQIAHTKQKQEQVITQKVEQIKKAYQELIDSNYSENAQQEYFNVFPDSFDWFVNLFGYFEKDDDPDFFKLAPLCETADLYVDNAFFKLSSINEHIFFKKIVNICIGGYWQADGVSALQHEMIIKFRQSFNMFYHILKKHSKEEIKSFWHFYFDGPAPGHPEKVKDYNQIIKKLTILDKDMAIILEEEYYKVNEDWRVYEIFVTQKSEHIKTIYQKLLHSGYSEVYQKKYFDAFPDSFNSFVNLFGYFEKDDDPKYFRYAPLSHNSYLHVQAFLKLSSIDKEDHLKKIINICIGGYWQGGGVYYFQDEMRIKFDQYFKTCYQLLKKHSEKEIKSFWHFYFSGSAPYHTIKVKDYNQLIKKLNTLDKDMVPVVKEAYTTEKEYWEKP